MFGELWPWRQSNEFAATKKHHETSPAKATSTYIAAHSSTHFCTTSATMEPLLVQ